MKKRLMKPKFYSDRMMLVPERREDAPTEAQTSRTRFIDSELGRLTFWGSECRTCGNSTPGSMRCDDCGLSVDTVALWMAPKEEKGSHG